MTYTKEIIQDYVFNEILEDTLISTGKENRYLVPDYDLGIEGLLGDDDLVTFYAPKWSYTLPNTSNISPYEDVELGTHEPENIQLRDDIACIMPVYAYVHSGVTISTSGFSCPWDSGQFGYAYITKDAQAKHGLKDKELINAITLHVHAIDLIYRGEVYTLVREDLDQDGNVIDYDCISGYLGYESALEALKVDL